MRPALTVVAEPERLAAFETDAYIQHRATPMAVVLPESEDQVRQIARALAALGVALVVAGRRHGPFRRRDPRCPTACCWCCTRMRRVLAVDAAARLATVEPGVANAMVTEAAAPAGLYFAPTPRARSSPPSAATSPRTPAACTASSTGSRSTT